MVRVACSVSLGLFALAVLSAQQLQVGQARTTAAVGLRARPNVNSPVLFELPAGAELVTIGGQREGEFVRVAGRTGPSGWAPAASVSVTGAPTLTPCPAQAEPPKKLAKFGNPTIIDFNDLLKLQMQAERGTVTANGRPVRLGGYLAGKPEGARAAGPCDGGEKGDWLLNIVSDPASKEYSGVVARISSTKRNPGWTLDRLRTVQEKNYPVLVTGDLFYDSGSYVNDDSTHPIEGQLRRASLWELRQVTSILVCSAGDCEVGSPKGWTTLDALR
jgi:hypothetical protein